MNIKLPPLDIDCPDCTGEAYEQIRRENAAHWKAWNAEEDSAFGAFVVEYEKTHKYGGAWEAWKRTDTCRDLSARQPEELPEVGCVECHYSGKQITDAGRQVLAFLHSHTKLPAK